VEVWRLKAIVLGFAYGFRYDTVPTISNLALLSYALHRNKQLEHLPFALQPELAEIAKVHFPQLNVEKVIITGQEGKIYRYDTEEIVRQGLEHALNRNYDTIYILAFPIFHRQLCYFIARAYAGRYGIKIKVVRTGWIPSDSTSDQWFCRNPLLTFIYSTIRALLLIFSRICRYDNKT